ncbi:MFS transporter [Nonomuraea deserti]|uniref:MFS transporter n=1 Tax=Nonomuraea deserti TaxID=1848322 RepID=A0A4R4VHT0_9ACTN|nr:MFS transporter [Nonomuraea deserti]TDD02293.1 MFS transporter [Nonomuraea deserti]
MAVDDQSHVTIGDVLASGEFRALWLAHSLSIVGDQIARVALSVLVFGRTGSISITALTYALTMVPALISGPLLGGMADRYPRRRVMVVADLIRAVLVLVMAHPGMPLPAVGMLVVAVVMLNAPFNAARLTALADILPGDRYTVGLGVTNTTQQAVQLLGFGGGGLIVATFGPPVALTLNAATFVVSAWAIATFVRSRAPATASDGRKGWLGHSALRGIRTLWRDPRLRYFASLTWLYSFFVVPEALAVPYTTQIGASSAAIGLFMGIDPACSAVGTLLITRFVPPDRRNRLLAPMAVLTGVPLLCFAVQPGLPIALISLGLTGFLSSYMVVAHARFINTAPDDQRGQLIGVGTAGLIAGQGLGILAGGALGELLGAHCAIAICAAAGVMAALVTIISGTASGT